MRNLSRFIVEKVYETYEHCIYLGRFAICDRDLVWADGLGEYIFTNPIEIHICGDSACNCDIVGFVMKYTSLNIGPSRALDINWLENTNVIYEIRFEMDNNCVTMRKTGPHSKLIQKYTNNMFDYMYPLFED
jgi:hypothetical protein